MKKQDTELIKKSDSRKLIFKLISISFPLLLLVVLEVLLRLFSYGENMHLFVKNQDKNYEKYMMVNQKVGAKYFQKLEYTAPANDIFLKEKPKESFRIFVMGSSTVFGFPYERNLMFSRILGQMLEDAYPDRNIEVVNTAITAINSYTLLDYTNEIIHYKPDAVLIYAGHNEFYGAFGIGSNESMSRSRLLTKLHFRFMDLRIYQLMRNASASIAQNLHKDKGNETGTLMKRIVSNKDIIYNSPEYRLAMKRYEQNMSEILGKFSSRGIPVFLSDLICNVKDMEPFNSVATDSLPAAIDVFKRATDSYDKGKYDFSLKLFYEAKDLDCVRFRASEEANQIIGRLGPEYNCYPVNMLNEFQSASEHRLIGNNLLTEHVHPNITGIFHMAHAFKNEILSSGLLGNDFRSTHSMEYYKRNWGYTELDSLIGYHRITNLKHYWPFVPAESNLPDYRVVYHPKNQLDSIAFNTFRDPEQTLGEARIKLAEEYKKNGKFIAAYREYEAILRTNPYVAVNYRDAASMLLNLGDLPLALKYFNKSLEYQESAYASFRIGEIYLIKGDYLNAINNLEKAVSISESNNDKIKALGKLFMACVYANNTAKAQAVARELEKANASQYLKIPPKQYMYTRYIPFQTRSLLKEAMNLSGNGKYIEAASLLEKSLEIYDSHMAHRYLGDIYFKSGNILKASEQYNEVYDEFAFDPDFLTNLALLNINIKDFQQAEKLLERIKSIQANYPSIPLLTDMLRKR